MGKRPHKSILGQRFGRLVTAEYLGKKGSYFWYRCKCDCGNQRRVMANALTAGHTRSCGCLKLDQLYAPKEGFVLARTVYSVYKGTARNKGIKFRLSFKAFLEISQQCCFYCGEPPSNIRIKHYTKFTRGFRYNGMDRVDNGKGYFKRNVVPCCHQCNVAKSEFTQEKFLAWVRRLVEYHVDLEYWEK